MAQLFPQWTNKAPLHVLATSIALIVLIIILLWYYASPKYTDVGYRPVQPVDYSHKLHAGDLGVECRYCHWAVDMGAHANVPSTKICMNCHQLVGTENDKLLIVRESWATNKPIFWIRVHKLPDYVYFDHSSHLYAGIGCFSCHGNVTQMHIVEQKEPLSMAWCLDCHRTPDKHIRPIDEITNMNWIPEADNGTFVNNWINEKNITPPVDCSGCHR